MKKFGDEGFIEILREGQQDARNTHIQKGSVWAGDTQLQFQEREIIKDLLWIWMPKEFAPLGKELIKIKYPNENRPDIIYSNQETTVNVSFSHKQEKLEAGQEEELRDYMAVVIQNLYPTCSILHKESVTLGENLVAWMDFVTPAIDMQIYNVMFFTPLKGRLLMGSCNCLAQDKEDWQDLFVQMLASIRTERKSLSD
ncbi:MAG: hypothetical protein K2P45_04530 [Eubacterium sp.]|nr:hypothetical protein [Eubacterium sp.]